MKTLIYILLTILLVGHPEAGVKIEESIEESTKVAEVISETAPSSDIVVILTNQEREKIGLKPLIENQLLINSAIAKACDMRDFNYWSHVSPDGTQPWDFFNEAGYVYRYAGENMCRDFNEITCINVLIESEKHRENILDPKFKEIGVGKCGVFTVQHFGTRK